MDVRQVSGLRQGVSGCRRSEWRRSGDVRFWEGLVAQVDGPPRAARPQSCLEGNLMEDWLQTLEKLQARPAEPQCRAFTDRTASLPALPNTTSPGPTLSPGYYCLQNRDWTPSVSSLDSLDSLDSHPGLEVREKARIKVAPSAQKAKLCRLSPVRIGWLPLQRHVVISNNPKPVQHLSGTNSQVKLKPPITPVFSSSSEKTCGSEGRTVEWSGTGASPGAQRPWRIPGHGSAQVSGSGNQSMAQDRTSSEQMLHSQSDELQPNSLKWITPVQRRGSIDRNAAQTSKHSSSISSITITSRKVVRSSSLPGRRTSSPLTINSADQQQTADSAKNINPQQSRPVPPQRKAVVVKVTEHREETRSVLQPGDKNSLTTEGSCSTPFSNVTSKRNQVYATSDLTSLDLESYTTSAPTFRDTPDPSNPRLTPRASTSRSPGSSTPTSQDTLQPAVVLRRKATIVKVEQRESCRREAKGGLEHRHSYIEGFRATSPVTYTSNPSHSNTQPLLPNEPSASASHSRALDSVQPSKSNEKEKELHRSTLSFQLSSPSNRPPLHHRHSREGPRRRRPASCYASVYSLSEPSAGAAKDPGFQSMTSALPQKTNIDPVSFTGSSSNRRWSTGGAGSCDEIYPERDSSAGDGGQRHKDPALLRSQQPFTLIKVPESSAHATHDAVLALNAAAVIANIKRQSLQRKSSQTHSGAKGEIPPALQSQTAVSGDKVCDGEPTAETPPNTPNTIRTPAHGEKNHYTEFIPLTTPDQPHTHSLRVTLEQRRPDFIRRSQTRVQAVEQRRRERLQLHTTTHTPIHTPTHTTTHTPTPAPRHRDNTFTSRDRSISVKQQQLRRNQNNLPEVKRRREEERRKITSQTNRLRVQRFKQKILDQVLHRGKD
ncbi:hypothetical protein AMEX_G18303 [Astyanax mexicanus]|uniref:ALMS motif domain-containing protein n=1 Tax=Astyanax mexicanus TaxID=7994 RepID=A0A8T2L774_ASTMX|nr:hypothetical protein AMEX_G18303 [Astyanax mexicanus]